MSLGIQVCESLSIYVAKWGEHWHGKPEALGSRPAWDLASHHPLTNGTKRKYPQFPEHIASCIPFTLDKAFLTIHKFTILSRSSFKQYKSILSKKTSKNINIIVEIDHSFLSYKNLKWELCVCRQWLCFAIIN